jgi:hypothetical protein
MTLGEGGEGVDPRSRMVPAGRGLPTPGKDDCLINPKPLAMTVQSATAHWAKLCPSAAMPGQSGQKRAKTARAKRGQSGQRWADIAPAKPGQCGHTRAMNAEAQPWQTGTLPRQRACLPGRSHLPIPRPMPRPSWRSRARFRFSCRWLCRSRRCARSCSAALWGSRGFTPRALSLSRTPFRRR